MLILFTDESNGRPKEEFLKSVKISSKFCQNFDVCVRCAQAHRGAGWAWRDMQMDVSCSWDVGGPGIG